MRTSLKRSLWLIGAAGAASATWMVAKSFRSSEVSELEYSLHCGGMPSSNQDQWTERARSRDIKEIYAIPAKLKADGQLQKDHKCIVRAARVTATDTRHL